MKEKLVKNLCFMVAFVTISITIFIIVVLSFGAKKFFLSVPLTNFLFGSVWSPESAAVTELADNSFGILPLLSGTLLISFISLVFAIPVGVFTAIYISQYASKKARFLIKPFMEIIAGIPSIVFGYLAAVFLSPIIKKMSIHYGFESSSEAALAAGIALGFMILPYIICLTEEAITSLPSSQSDGAYALGATKCEVITKVLIPGCKNSIYIAILLSFLRAIGETMIVTMAAGISANLSLNPLQSVTTFTVQIVTILSGDQEFASLQVSSSFALSLFLIFVCFLCNYIIYRFLKK